MKNCAAQTQQKGYIITLQNTHSSKALVLYLVSGHLVKGDSFSEPINTVIFMDVIRNTVHFKSLTL